MGLAAFNRARKEREAQTSPPPKQETPADEGQDQKKKKRTAQGDK